MNRDDFNAVPGSVVAPQTVRLERLLPGPVERVWTYLTESGKRKLWLAAGDFELRQGGRAELRFDHSALTSERPPERYGNYSGGHALAGQITAIEPPRLIAYSWPEGGQESEVTFELAKRGDSVLLTVTHRRLGDRKAMISVAGGWDAHTGLLSDLLEERTPRGFWTEIDRLEAMYETRFASA